MPKPAWWNLPNQITLSRIAIAFVLFALLSLELTEASLFTSRAVALWVAAAVFGVCVSTDWLDGWIARRRKQVTTFGLWNKSCKFLPQLWLQITHAVEPPVDFLPA